VILGLQSLTICLVYWTGLSGPFLFDDHWNLSPLGAEGGIESFSHWLRFVLEGESGPLGRPISLASFTLNAQHWPADPWPFKLTNLLLHLSNTMLLYALSNRLFHLSRLSHASTLAALAALLWALHPLHVSTVLYVVQRMAQLSLLFTLIGLSLYLHGRVLAIARPRAGYLLMLGGVGIGTLLATLSKENGALLPLYALVIEVTVIRFSGIPPPMGWRYGQALVLRIPILLLIAYFAISSPAWLLRYLNRDFSLLQRLGAEGPILWDYLNLFAIPSLSGSGLFHDVTVDDYSTLMMVGAWLGIAALMAIAWHLRSRAPLIAAGLLWFFAGHAMESTFLPLELYFEHRNYLPFIGLTWALMAALSALPSRFIGLAAGTLLLLWGTMTHLQARVWGNEQVAAQVWLKENPESLRATQFAAGVLQENGAFDASRMLIHNYTAQHPRNPIALLQRIELDCLAGAPVASSTRLAATLLSQGPYSHAMPSTFNQLLSLAVTDHCSDLDYVRIHQMLNSILSNPQLINLPRAAGQLLITQGNAFAQQGDWRSAIASAEQAGRINQQINAPYWQALWSLEAGNCDAARDYLRAARALATGTLYTEDPPASYLDALDQVIRAPARAGGCAP
jgi:protein O-mannosyl-transferase